MIISGGIFEKNKIKDEIEKLDKKTTNKDFWKDQLGAQKILKKKNFFLNILNNYNSSLNELENLEQLFELAESENDFAVLKVLSKKKLFLF